MDLTIVAVYTICDDLLISIGHQEHPQAKMSDAEVMTTVLVAARYFGMLGHSRFNRRLHRIPQFFQVLLNTSQKVRKREILMVFMSLTLFRYLSATTFGFHVHVSITVNTTHLYAHENMNSLSRFPMFFRKILSQKKFTH
jgi:hypothetical protein